METFSISCLSLVKGKNYRTIGVVIVSLFLLTFIICVQYMRHHKTGFVSTLVHKDIVTKSALRSALSSRQTAGQHSTQGLILEQQNTTVSSYIAQLFNDSVPRASTGDLMSKETFGSVLSEQVVVVPAVRHTTTTTTARTTTTTTTTTTATTTTAKTAAAALFPVTIDAPYLLENPTLCTAVKNLSVLVIVHTAPNHFQRRQNSRMTWANNIYFQNLGTVRILFLLGKVKDVRVQNKIEREFREHGDLLQGNFVDDYHNLTHKGVMAFKWISERCTHAGMILKVDDDVVVNTYKLLTEVLPKFQNRTKYILCNHILPGTMPIIRERTSKWYVKESEFKGKSRYPRYCSGFTVMMSTDLPARLHDAARRTPFFWVDDVYLYGLLPGKVRKVWYDDLKGNFSLGSAKSIACFENTAKPCPYLVSGGVQRAIVGKLWNLMGESFYRQHNPTNSGQLAETIVPVEQKLQEQLKYTKLQ